MHRDQHTGIHAKPFQQQSVCSPCPRVLLSCGFERIQNLSEKYPRCKLKFYEMAMLSFTSVNDPSQALQGSQPSGGTFWLA